MKLGNNISIYIILIFCLLIHSSNKMKPVHQGNQIVIKGFAYPQEIKTLVEFYTVILEIESVNIIVTTSSDLPKCVEGYILYEKTPQGQQQAFIQIGKNLNWREIQRVLAHELVHLKQYVSGKLKRLSTHQYLWNGELIQDIHHKNYYNRAWENEAISKESELVEAYHHSKQTK